MHFAKAVTRTVRVELIRSASLAIPRFAQSIDPIGREPAAVSQNEVVFVVAMVAGEFSRAEFARPRAYR
jgi:hypothetical protein